MVTEVDSGLHSIIFTLSVTLSEDILHSESSSVKNLTADSLFSETKQKI